MDELLFSRIEELVSSAGRRSIMNNIGFKKDILFESIIGFIDLSYYC